MGNALPNGRRKTKTMSRSGLGHLDCRKVRPLNRLNKSSANHVLAKAVLSIDE